MIVLTTEDLPNIQSNLDAMPFPWCEYLIDDYCPCIAMCEDTELWEDCCECERCCFCGE